MIYKLNTFNTLDSVFKDREYILILESMLAKLYCRSQVANTVGFQEHAVVNNCQ